MINGAPAPKILDNDKLESPGIPQIARKLAENEIILRKEPDAPKLDSMYEVPPPK